MFWNGYLQGVKNFSFSQKFGRALPRGSAFPGLSAGSWVFLLSG